MQTRDIHPDAEIAGAFKTKDILDACLNHQFDVIFLDIDMPQANGIDIAKRVLEKYPRTNIIYITGYEKYAVESYETNASTFLLKPITKKAIEKALDNLRFPISDIPEEMLLAEFS